MDIEYGFYDFPIGVYYGLHAFVPKPNLDGLYLQMQGAGLSVEIGNLPGWLAMGFVD